MKRYIQSVIVGQGFIGDLLRMAIFTKPHEGPPDTADFVLRFNPKSGISGTWSWSIPDEEENSEPAQDHSHTGPS